METVKFAEDFPKLQDDFFTTIRRHDKDMEVGRHIIKTPTEEFEAYLVDIQCEKVMDIPTDLFCYDTNTSNEDEALEKLREFYPYIRVADYVKIFYFARLWDESKYPDGWYWCDKCGIPFRMGKGDSIFMRFQGHKPRGRCRFCNAKNGEEVK
jgi:hypothetical protein